MLPKEELRQIVKNNLDPTIQHLNTLLRSQQLESVESIILQISKGSQLPHWYQRLKTVHSLPNLDGKTIGSVIETLFAAVLEIGCLSAIPHSPLQIQPARGVDLPSLDLNIKSPSENHSTSEPFISPYERLLGSGYDTIVLLTDYQQSKKNNPFCLQVLQAKYLTKTQMADETLCKLAKKHREWLCEQDVIWAKKLFRYLVYVNQSDWRANKLLHLVDVLQQEEQIEQEIKTITKEFHAKNKKLLESDKPPIPESDLRAIERIWSIRPLRIGVIDAVDNWVIETYADFGRFPNNHEWQRILTSPLDGLVSMSPALQWRYNFRKLFPQGSS